LEKIIHSLVLSEIENLFRKDPHIENSANATILIDHRESEEFVEHEKFASLEESRLGRNSYHPADHAIAQRHLERFREQTPCRQNALQHPILTGHIEIDDFFSYPLLPDEIHRLANMKTGIEYRKLHGAELQNRSLHL
jgi:hypothetical protein